MLTLCFLKAEVELDFPDILLLLLLLESLEAEKMLGLPTESSGLKLAALLPSASRLNEFLLLLLLTQPELLLLALRETPVLRLL